MKRSEWVKNYQNEKTRKQAEVVLSAFDKYLEANLMQERELFKAMKEGEQNHRYIELQKIINFWKDLGISAKSIKNYWNFLKNWFWYNGVSVVKEELKAYVKFPREFKDMKEPLEINTIQTLIHDSNQVFTTLWLVLASSGMRIEEALSIDPSSIEWGTIEKPTRIILSPEITKYAQGREVFISDQASEYLKNNLDHYLRLTVADCETYMSRLRKRTKLLEKYSNGKNYKVHIHAFKSFFITAAAMVHDEKYSHALGGHSKYLPEYYRIPKKKREEMYKQLEENVTIPF
jgi:integrase